MTTRDSFRPRLRIRDRSPAVFGFAALTPPRDAAVFVSTAVEDSAAIEITGCAAAEMGEAGTLEAGAEVGTAGSVVVITRAGGGGLGGAATITIRLGSLRLEAVTTFNEAPSRTMRTVESSNCATRIF